MRDKINTLISDRGARNELLLAYTQWRLWSEAVVFNRIRILVEMATSSSQYNGENDIEQYILICFKVYDLACKAVAFYGHFPFVWRLKFP